MSSMKNRTAGADDKEASFAVGDKIEAVKESELLTADGSSAASSEIAKVDEAAPDKHKSVYHRKGFGLKDEVEGELKKEYESDLVAELRASGNVISRNGMTIKLAEAFGFCWGVDRAVSMAYETRKHFPDRRIWITNEIIHNPVVNANLREMGIEFLGVRSDGSKDFSSIGRGDVVILPAFGASVEEMRIIEGRNCEIVDTTCPWVSRVWNRVVKYAAGFDHGYTAIIHGKPNHEETVATASRAHCYLIVRNIEEAGLVASYILSGIDGAGGDREAFMKRFQDAVSPGFDPDVHLQSIGIANQTTMLKGETEQIGKLFEKTMLQKYGPQSIDKHFISPGDTICDATQERQDAMLKLVDEKLDLMLVIGGFNSSNTGHLQEIAEKSNLPSYHIDGADCIGPGNQIRFKPLDGDDCQSKVNFLPDGEVTIGLTAGASTPDQLVAQVLEKLFSIRQ
ncbi:MAG TPA: 4-hydroxy-3-methylbut-2-enyl diphosphate reductase [Candidatus Obscuribacter sp.]|nr:4-hydroxy-3-methylbut-2-enyl diphosphate reductase [Candidatus Obscuribacter sp.]HNH73489.1 4-hydroxy-3-methylbut-2-enyl diphosphate reductase [Candidatus Obscuribacter sp.]HNN62699.1 4-hydroxy-3-methylbut-2-enyl diphosphate reductase [Candidatus Obscuribacter sp.]